MSHDRRMISVVTPVHDEEGSLTALVDKSSQRYTTDPSSCVR